MVVFDENWFLKHQKPLLRLVNTRLGKWFFRIHKDVPAGKRIVQILPNCYTWVEEGNCPKSPSIPLLQRGKRSRGISTVPGKPRITYTTDFRTHDKFGKRLYYGLKPVWYTLHYIDSFFLLLTEIVADIERVGRRMPPAYTSHVLRLTSLAFAVINFGFDTLTAYPAAGASSPCDGYVGREASGGEPFATIRSGTGVNANAQYGEEGTFISLQCHSSLSDKYTYLSRSLFAFDTSGITDQFPVLTAVFSLSVITAQSWDTIGMTDAQCAISLVGATPASFGNLIPSDYGQLGVTRLASDIPKNSVVNGYNDMPMNSSGLNAINRTGITGVGVRYAVDTDAGTPPWVAGQDARYWGYFADASGTANDPKLVVTYLVVPQTKTLSDSATISDSIETQVQSVRDISDSASLSDSLSTKLMTLLDVEAAKKTGTSPVWILKCPFATGVLYLSDRTFTVPSWNGGITTKPWISTWNAIDEDISGEIAMTKVSDLSLDMRIDPKATQTIHDILWHASNNIETTDCELYLWFEGLDASFAPPRLMWVGNIYDHEKLDEILVRVDLVDQSVRLDKYIGTKTDLATYPSCDPDDVGKVIPIIYGSVTKVPTLIVDAGAQTSLPNSISVTVTSFAVSDGSRLSAGKVIQIDDEQIYISGISGDTITSCTRGYNSTLGATHWRGASVWEKKASFVYLWADHAVKSIGKIYGKVGNAELDITAICTKYTGQTGNQLSGYGAKAVITVPGYITVEQAVELLVNAGIDASLLYLDTTDTLTIKDIISLASQIVNDVGITDNIEVSQGSHGHNVPVESSKVQVSTTSMPYTKNQAQIPPETITFSFNSPGGTITEQIQEIDLGGSSGVDEVRWDNSAGALITGAASRSTSSSSNSLSIWIQWGGTSGGNQSVLSLKRTATYTQAASATSGAASGVTRTGNRLTKNAATVPTSTKISNAGGTGNGDSPRSGSGSGVTGGGITGRIDLQNKYVPASQLSITGNSVANTLVGDEILISGEGYKDDASGTYTGTANALIERPDHVIKHLLAVYGGWAVANFYTNAGSSFASKNYKFAGVINEYKRLKEWLAVLSFQCRCYFRFAEGKATLLYRPDTITSSRTIIKNMVRMDGGTKKTTLRGPRPSPLYDVINKINLHFDRDWDQNGDNAYKGMSKDSNSASITKYGEKEKPELFYFDFVTSQSMADDVRAFYLARYKDRKKDYNMEVFLDNVDCKFAAGVTIEPAGDVLAEVQKVNIYPGSGRDMRNDRITLHVREY